MRDNFNPEKVGIPYDEIAKICADMDIKEQELMRRQQEAENVFNDVKEFFECDQKWLVYLTAIISKQNVKNVLEDIEMIFLDSEDYEKCALIKSWKEKVDSLPEEE